MNVTSVMSLVSAWLALIGSLGFVAIYAIGAPWHRSKIGYMLIAFGLGIFGLSLVYVLNVEFNVDIGALRIARTVFSGLVAVMMWAYAIMAFRLQWANWRKNGN